MKKTMIKLVMPLAAAICVAAVSAWAAGPLDSIDDVRVAPLLTTHWAQGNAGSQYCYNYYTPLHRVCGCTATALGQIMYYHRYPTERILPGEYLYDTIDDYGKWWVFQDGTGGMTNTTTGVYTEFDPPYGGPYEWNKMVDSPTGSTPAASRAAIGRLTRDAGLAVFSHYFTGETSGFTAAVASSVILNLHYADAVKTGFNAGKLIANLDAGLPVLLNLTSHAVVADGYGYQDDKLYIHINYGYGGSSDGWYDTTTDVNGKNLESFVANIFPPTRGARHSSVISGRILDANGDPVANATITATDLSSYAVVSTNSNAKGIYAFILPAGNYALVAESGNAIGNGGYTVLASSQKTRAEGDGWGSGENNSASGVDITVSSDVDYGKCWRNNAGDGLFSNPQNWSDNTLPASGEDVTVIATSETLITSASDMTVGTVSIPFGVARFGGSGVITVGGVDVSFGASLATGGALRFSSLAIPSGAVVEITGVEGLADAGITGAGTLMINPGAGNTLTMTKNNTGFTGQAVIKSGTVKFGDRRSFGARPARIRVKGGATLDESNVSDGDYVSDKNIATLEAGATLIANPGNKGDQATLSALTLEGDATVDTSFGGVAIAQFYNYNQSRIELGTNTLTKIGTGDFFISSCAISGMGMFDISQGRVVVSPMYNGNPATTCSSGTIRIRAGASVHVNDNYGKATTLSVNNLVLDGSLTRGTAYSHVLSVTGSITGNGTTQMLTMKPGAVFKPTGTGYLTVTESFSGAFRLDLGGLDLSSTNEVPLVKVSSSLASSVTLNAADIPQGWGVQRIEEGGMVFFLLKEGYVEEEVFYTHLLGRFAKRAEDFEVDDYVQTGLIAHYDGIRNAGAGADHDSNAETWVNLGSGGSANDATLTALGSNIPSGASDGEWTDSGYYFKGKQYFALGGTISLGKAASFQIVTDYTTSMSDYSSYPVLFGGCSSDSDQFVIWHDKGKLANMNFKVLNNKKSAGNWDGYFINVLYDGVNSRCCISQGTAYSWITGSANGNIYSQNTTYAIGTAGKNDSYKGPRTFNGIIKAVRVYDDLLTEEELAWNRVVDEARFRGVLTPAGGDIVIASNTHGRDGTEPCGEYMVNGSHTFSAESQMVNGRLWELNGYTLEKWDYDTGTWTFVITNSEATSFAYTNSVLNGRMRLTWLWTAAKPVWTNADGTGSLESAANWNFIPEPGEDVTMNLSGDTAFTSVEAKSYGVMTINGGYSVNFSNAATVTLLDGIALNGVTNLVTGGNLRVRAINIASGVVVEITGAEGLVDGGLTGVGTLVINPGAGNTYTMTKNNGANAVPYDAAYFWGEAVIASGTVKCGNSWSFGARRDNNDNRRVPTVRVKGGATLDENALSTGDYGGETLRVILEEGATLKSTGNASSGLTSIILEGNATVDTSSGKVVACYGYDSGSSPVSVSLGTNTLTKIGSGQFYFSACRFSGTGTLDVQEGEVRVKVDGWNYFPTSSIANGTLRIRSGATFTLEARGDKPTHFTVKDLVLDGTIARTAANCVFTVTGSVTGSITGNGTTQMLTMGDSAVFKPSGTGYLTITDSLSGVLKLDLSDPGLSDANKIPLVKVPSALTSSVSFDNQPKGYELKIDEADGTVEYWLKHRGFSIILR